MSNEESYRTVIPIDLGFGWTKGKSNELVFRQPSVLGEARFVHESDFREDDVIYGGNKYFVGNLALRQSNIRYYSISDNKNETWITKILLRSALAKISPKVTEFLVTGIPLDFYSRQKKQMEKFLDDFKKPQDFQVTFGGKETVRVSPSIKNYKIVPQPFGAGMHYLLDENGKVRDKNESKQIIIVADLGFHTFDLLVLDGMEMHRYSHSDTEISIANTYKLIQEFLRDQTGRAPDIYQLDMHMLRGEYEGFNLSPLASKAFTALSKQIDFAIQSLNLNYHKLILTGGWSAEIADILPNKDDRLIVFDQDGNINGYEKIGRRFATNEHHATAST